MHPVRPTKIISVCILRALLSGAGALAIRASLPAAGSDLSITLTPAFASQYMFRGERRGGPSLEPAIVLSTGDVIVGLWSNVPLAHKVPGYSGPEFDFYGSGTFELVKDTLSLTPGGTLYTYPKAPTASGYYRAAFEPSLALNYTAAGVRFTPTCYYDLMRRGPTGELNATVALPLTGAGTELDLTGTAGAYYLHAVANHATPRVKAWGDYWLLAAAVPFQLSNNAKLTLGFAYTRGAAAYTKAGTQPKAANPLAVGRGVATVSYAITF